ncbi:alpha-L-fucosidase [Clostridium oryzae]|uniref:alpha-L-fucosidase n=1 Tax=Clostridium oryzae TaxID=1450648 RepID=A0A1V4IXH3_9CLOT|nr:alpha-L-fucosidase [Clostridium oryzae]OPJ64593.1 alpha-L-fucosidase [Clostridium oryzae]
MDLKREDIEQAKYDSIDNNEYEESAMVRKRLEWFQDQKVGLIFHWGVYAVSGVVESWQLSEGDEWARPGWKGDIKKLQKDYWDMNKKFNPTKFNPDSWAEVAEKAGMKYMVFTTKHHDGFNMFDTKYSDYKVTGKDCPFNNNPRANIVKEVFDAFRKKNIGIGAYYSKADWHCPYYWVPGERALSRYASYDEKENPEMWNKFVEFVHGQFEELMRDYGHVDILWLDAGWVCAPREDIKMDEIAKMARSYQPELLIVDRTVGGRHENYITPERCVPDAPLEKPWESCITMANNWGYVPNDEYKSITEVIHTLVDIVAKGGNLLLGVGPKPDGTLPEEAVNGLLKVGDWLNVNGEAIYGTRAYKPYREGKCAFTQKGNDIYVIYLMDEKEKELPESIEFEKADFTGRKAVSILGSNEGVSLVNEGNITKIVIPKAARKIKDHAVVFKL